MNARPVIHMEDPTRVWEDNVWIMALSARQVHLINGFQFIHSSLQTKPYDIFITHINDNKQKLEELINLYVLAKGDDNEIPYDTEEGLPIYMAHVIAREAIFMDCAKLLEAIK